MPDQSGSGPDFGYNTAQMIAVDTKIVRGIVDSSGLVLFYGLAFLAYFQAESRERGNRVRQHHSHGLRRDACLVQSKVPSLGIRMVVLVGLPALSLNDVLLGTAGIPRCAPPEDKLKSAN